MVRPIFETFTPATVSTTYFAASVSGAAFTLTNNNTTDILAHQVTIQGLGATNLSAINVVLVGIGQDGNTQTETLALPNGTAVVTSTLYYKSLTSATPASTIGIATVKIGFNNVIASRTIPVDWRGSLAFVDTYPSGTINTTVQYTGDNIQGQPNTPADPRPYRWQSDASSALTGATTPASDTFNSTPIGLRLLINSYSTSASVRLTISQMKNRANNQNVICDTTGFKRKRSDVSYQWNGTLVLPEAWDPYPQYLIPPNTTDNIGVPDSRPDSEAVFITPLPSDLDNVPNF